MQYKITKDEAYNAQRPHHIFNVNVIVTHLAAPYVILELARGSSLPFIIVPIVSGLVIFYLYSQSKKTIAGESWFTAAHWTLAWRRGRNLLLSYATAIVVFTVASLLGSLFGGGLMMNDFSEEGSSTSIVEKIGTFFSAIVIFFTVLYNFLQTGISVYDAGKGIVDEKIEEFVPRDENSNIEIPEDEKTV